MYEQDATAAAASQGFLKRSAKVLSSRAISGNSRNPIPAPGTSSEMSSRNSFAAAALPAGRSSLEDKQALSEELGVSRRKSPLRLEREALDFKIGKAPHTMHISMPTCA